MRYPSANRPGVLFPGGLCLLGTALALAVWPSCGDDDVPGVTVRRGPGDSTNFGDGTIVVVNDEDTWIVSGDPGDDCVEVGEDCIDIDEETGRYCDLEGAQADIIVVDGEVVDVICYPPSDEGTPVEEVAVEGDAGAEIPQPESGEVLVFDESTDGTIIEGDLTIEAERTTLFGNGVDETTLGGDVHVTSNNSRIRGLTIQGNVDYGENANNSALSFCRIHGNLQVESNDFTAVECEVFGNVDVNGNNATLMNVGVGGEWQVDGSNPVCDGCYSFDDADDDFRVADEERGDPVTCGEE